VAARTRILWRPELASLVKWSVASGSRTREHDRLRQKHHPLRGIAAPRGLHLGLLPNSPPPRCSIALWRGYVAAQFYLRDPEGGALALSRTFRTWRFPWQARKPLDKDTRAVAALASLRADLVSSGWERMRRAPGSEWYEFRFRPTGSAPGSSDPRGRARKSRRGHVRSRNGSTSRPTTSDPPIRLGPDGAVVLRHRRQ
jgi:hypothetical protein